MRDPYEVLGVAKTASAAEIKSAFRRQAKKLHPDANKHDPRAAARFAEVNAAYEILGEESKRRPSIVARSMPRESRASRALKVLAVAVGRVASSQRTYSKPSVGGETAFNTPAAALAASRIF